MKLGIAKRSVLVTTTSAVLLGVSLAVSQVAQADTILKPENLLMIAPPSSSSMIAGGDWREVSLDPVKIKNLKNSNSGVVEARPSVDEFGTGIVLTPLAAGKSVVTFKTTIENVTELWTYKVTVKKYTKPFKTFKVGKKDLTSKANKAVSSGKTVKVSGKQSGKLKVKMNSGWKFSGEYKSGGKYGSLKNGKSVTIKKGGTLFFNLHMAATVDGKKLKSGNVVATMKIK